MTGNDMTDRTINFIMKNNCYTVYKSLNQIMLMIRVFEHLPALAPPNPPTQAAPQASSQSKPFRPLPPPSNQVEQEIHIRTENSTCQNNPTGTVPHAA